MTAITSTRSAAARTASSSAPMLRTGSSGAAVSELQKLLKGAGLYTSAIDGKFGPKTDAAVRSFQRKYGLKVDGLAGPQTMAKLRSVTAPKPPAPAPSSSGGALKRGATGAAVKELQTLLHSKGFYSGSIGGNFGAQTEAAVRNFQSRNGLTADGWAGPQTMAKLRSVAAPKPPAPPSTSSGGALKRGATGAAVKELQTLLRSKGFYSGSIGGNFGAQTEAAVRNFQSRSGLAVDGWAGPQTMARLRSSAPVGPVTPPTTAPVGKGVAAAIAYGKSVIGSPYAAVNPFRFGDVPWDGKSHRSQNGSSSSWNYPKGTRVFDCSGFVVACFRRAGVDLAKHGLSSSWDMRSNSQGFMKKISKSELKVGDVITYSPHNGVGHVVIYMGDGKCIESNGSRGVTMSTVNWSRADSYHRVPLPN